MDKGISLSFDHTNLQKVLRSPTSDLSRRLSKISAYRFGQNLPNGSQVRAQTKLYTDADRIWAAGSSLTSGTVFCPRARHIYPCLVLVQQRKTRPNITEKLLA